MKFNTYIICFVISIITLFSCSVFAKNAHLKVIVKTSTELPIKKALHNLASDIEKTAKIYKTTNQKTYWKSEGKKSYKKLLNSKGYYSGIVHSSIQNENNSLLFTIDAGNVYKFGSITIIHKKGSNKKITTPSNDSFSIKKGDAAIAEKLLDTQQKLYNFIEKNNCLLSLNVNHEATIDHLENTIDIVFIINAGPSATINNVEFTGLKKVKHEHVKKLAGLKQDQCFKKTYILEAQGKLQKSGLFSLTRPSIPNKTNKNGSVDIKFNLQERKHKSVKAGLNYGTDLGPGVTLGWEHRNFFGNGERLRAKIFGNKNEQTLDINYFEDFFIKDNQNLKLNVKAETQKSKAFDSKEIILSGFIERTIEKNWTAGVGATISNAKITNGLSNSNFVLLSTPIFLTHDTKNNILNPQKGHEITIGATPFFSLNKNQDPFFKTNFSYAKYFPLPFQKKHILAVKASTGNIFGIADLKVPQTEKFYVGGGNSVRGYAHQFAEDLDSKRKPKGGRSFIETAIELRFQLTENIGMTTFLDSGTVYRNKLPKSKQPLFHGAGVGLRYITSFGPIRIDVGFPLKRRKYFENGKRKFIDDAFQVYFGIGQAF